MSSNQDAITQFLAGKGLTAAQIAGVEGNLQTESGFNPAAANPREGAVGIAQWEGGRRTALDAYAKASGGSETDLSTQLGFLWSELTGSEHGALTGLLATSTPADAARVFDQQYERSSAASLPARIANAQAIAAGGVAGGSGQVATGSGGSGGAGPTAAPAGWLSSLTTAALRPFGKIALDAGLVVMGLIMLIVAAVIVAKGGDAPPAAVPAAAGDEDQADEHPRGRAGGAAEGGAEDAAVVAA